MHIDNTQEEGNMADPGEHLQEEKTGDEEERGEDPYNIRDEHLRMVEDDGEDGDSKGTQS